MKWKLSMTLFIYLLIHLSNIQTVSAETSGNADILLELEQITPTTVPITTPQQNKTTHENSVKKEFESLSLGFSSPYISFGFLVPGDPLIRTDKIYITSTDSRGYSVFISQDHPLQADNHAIPDTTCDSGSCTPNIASFWESPLTFGFGIQCKNSVACSKDFNAQHAYRPIASLSKSENPAQILSSSESVATAEIVYKLNISPNQEPLPYTNILTYTLIPQL